MNSLIKRIYTLSTNGAADINLRGGGRRNLTVIRESWLVVKNVPGFIGADMIAVIENNVPFRRREYTHTHTHTWMYDQKIRAIDSPKRFSIFSVMRSEILRFPHHPCLSFRWLFIVRQNKRDAKTTHRIPLNKSCSAFPVRKIDYANRPRAIH